MTRPVSEAPDVTILGAGIIGVCCALEALAQGLSVEVIDRLPPGEATSYGNAGSLSPWSIVPLATPGIWKKVPRWLFDPKGPVKLRWRDLPQILPWVAAFMRNSTPKRVEQTSDGLALMMRNNVDLYRRHLQGTGHERLLTDAMMVTAYRGNMKPSMDDIGIRLRVERGGDVRIIGAADLRDVEPAISHDYHSAVLVRDGGRTTDPGRLCKVLAEKAAGLGATFRRLEVTYLSREEDRTATLHTAQGPMPTRKLVLAAGVWSANLLKPLGLDMPLIAERGYHLQFADPGITLNNSVQDVDAKVVLSSMDGGVRCAGTAEFADINAPPDYRRAEMLAPLSKRLLPDLNTDPRAQWMGIRPSFPDNLPAIGALPGTPNVVVAFGHGHHGLGMAPVTARIVASDLTGAPANTDYSAVRPNRFIPLADIERSINTVITRNSG